MKINNTYSTSDLSLATFLSMHFPLWAVDRTDSIKAQFLFERSKQLDQLIELFWRGDAKVNPVSYFSQLKIMKSRLHETN